MLGKFRRSSSGLYIFDFWDDEFNINKIIEILRKNYVVELSHWYGNLGFEESQDIIIKKIKINISWDYIGGCSIIALDLKGNAIICEIVNYLENVNSENLLIKGPNHYCNKAINLMHKSYNKTRNRDDALQFCREAVHYCEFDQLPQKYFAKIHCEYKKICSIK
ncbi:hypothetical protein [Clostridium saccharobutylicum]|uniref:Uncharacterized protein n=1 Tax=Clostridium saccharobutylicum TaxID=169679 RepID=A0A1S8MRJ2_CLOSA|nr:hypothetical protein [Clostridium saccharobutylicum]OOM06791.1 hypothetical protein CLOSAC_42210 [Clostridium saccharobutylicum]